MRWPFMLKKTHERRLVSQHDGWVRELKELQEKYERVQHGYDQGVLEGKRQGYANVRATLADEMLMAGGMDGMKIRAFITPLLSGLGTEETRLLDEMKGHIKTEPVSISPEKWREFEEIVAERHRDVEIEEN